MTFTEIRDAVISRITAQTAIPADSVTYPNGPTFNPAGRPVWARLTDVPGLAGVTEIGQGPVVHRTGIIIIQIFVPAGSGTRLITETADQIRELFEFRSDGRLDYFAVSVVPAGEISGWAQRNLHIPYRAL
ncbi:phage tail terminator-like protein [Pantoea osteomyelitidis]|uniref:Phage tail terminator-like protein n=1 Tax=Pantoea osteomyelitidis TaxID=3230026 RepID=A0ABW7PW64_9GAMM